MRNDAVLELEGYGPCLEGSLGTSLGKKQNFELTKQKWKCII